MRPIVAATIAFAAAGTPVAAQTVRGPHLTPGDTWSYADGNEARGQARVVHVTATLVRTDSLTIAIEVRPTGSPNAGNQRLFGPNWSRVRSVNGQQTTVSQPLAFPMAPGKSWTLDYSETAPANRAHTRETWHTVYRVRGWEDVAVAGGTFHALKIEGDGTWTADLPSNTVIARGRAPNGTDIVATTRQGARVTSGRFLNTFWYVPEVHRWAKSEEDIFDSNGVRTQHTTEDLESFTLADPAGAATADTPEADAPPPRPKHARAHKPTPAPAAAASAPPKTPAAKPHPPAPAPPPLQETRAILHRIAGNAG